MPTVVRSPCQGKKSGLSIRNLTAGATRVVLTSNLGAGRAIRGPAVLFCSARPHAEHAVALGPRDGAWLRWSRGLPADSRGPRPRIIQGLVPVERAGEGPSRPRRLPKSRRRCLVVAKAGLQLCRPSQDLPANNIFLWRNSGGLMRLILAWSVSALLAVSAVAQDAPPSASDQDASTVFREAPRGSPGGPATLEQILRQGGATGSGPVGCAGPRACRRHNVG